MSHLSGPRAAALVDAELAPASRDRAVAHLAACPACRERVLAERAARRLLAGSADVLPSEALRARLLAVPGSTEVQAPPSRSTPRRAPGWVGVLALSGAASVCGLFVLGLSIEPGLDDADLTAPMLAAAPVAAAAPLAAGSRLSALGDPDDLTGEALGWLTQLGWAAPSTVPSTLRVVNMPTSQDGLVAVELVGAGSRVVLLERRGRLDPAVRAGATRLEGLGSEAYLVSDSPWVAVKQSGDVAVAVICHGPDLAGRQVLAAIPDTAPALDPGDRIGRGWETVTASLTRLAGR